MVNCGFDCFKCSPKGIVYFEGHQSQNHLKSYKTIDSIVVCCFFKGRGEAGGIRKCLTSNFWTHAHFKSSFSHILQFTLTLI